MVHPKKKFGQHFLTEPAIAEKIVDAMDPQTGEVIMEIGPGKGILTRSLLKKEIHLVPVEIDPELVAYLTGHYPALSANLIEGDVLKIDWHAISEEPFGIIGNFPYNISSQIFFRILEHRQWVNRVVCMLQKEVAARLASPPGSRDYGILSVLLQAYFDIEYLFSVRPGSFFPPPKVHSGVIRLKRNQVFQLDCDERLFFEIVKTSFNQRRKTIRNSLKPKLLNLVPDSGLLSLRPEQLSVGQFVELAKLIQNAGGSATGMNS
ncbi:MAG: ribosomal RNA small subunit methyltransferase A [Bacteroidales bacterium]|nr:ribosomal RNA small subunit methyltransferase A [Bacteroidales bacterium]MBN2699602.1 ribosomal RNA small subunit methyltransferase A [Bacteroidales bacterium]